MTYYLIKVADWLWTMKTWIVSIFGFLLWFSGLVSFLVVEGFKSILFSIGEFVQYTTDPNSMIQLQAQTSILEAVGVGNAILPLNEMLALYAVYVGMWVALISLRWIKSFIPTLAN